MVSEVVEPEVERVKLSLAEENLIEQIHSYILKLATSFQEAKNILDDLFRQRFEIAKTRTNKLHEDLRNIYVSQSSLARYIAKLSMSVANGSYYISLMDVLTSLTGSIYRLMLNLELLSISREVIDEAIIISIQNIVERIKAIMSCVCDIFKYLVVSPSKVYSYASIIEKEFNELIQIFREVYVNQKLDANKLSIIMLMSILNTIIQEVYSLGEKALCLYMIRAP